MTWGKKNKFNNVKVFKYGRNWDSKLELAVYEMLLQMERGGKFRDIKCQASVRFHTHEYGNIWMIPDFKAFDIPNNEEVWIEAKGKPTASWIRKKKAWKKGGPGKLYVYGGKWTRPLLFETIVSERLKHGVQRGGEGHLSVEQRNDGPEQSNKEARVQDFPEGSKVCEACGGTGIDRGSHSNRTEEHDGESEVARKDREAS